MKSKEEIEQLAEQWFNNEILFKDRFYTNSKELRKGYENGYSQCQKDMDNEIQSLIDGYNSDILLLEEEFIDSSSVLIVEKMVTLADVIHNLYKTINK